MEEERQDKSEKKEEKREKNRQEKQEERGIIWYRRGMRDGIPIGLGYFAVAFTLGIAAKKAGLTPLQASLMSATMLASAGQFAGINMIAGNAGVLEIVVTELVVNLRYLLMSGALSQKVRRDKPFYHRFLMAYEVTDEIFGIAMSVEGRLHPAYMYGAVTVAAPGWVFGTFLGTVVGMVLPVRVMNALNVALYGMFLAVVIPPSRKSRIIALVVVLSMAASAVCSVTPVLNQVSSGFQMILLTILLAGAAAVLFPVQEEGGEQR